MAPQEFSLLFESDRHRWLAAGPGIFGDMGIILEIELRGERDVQRFRNSEMDMSGSRQPCVFLQPWKIWRNRISSRHDGFELIVPLLIGQHHGSQVEIPAFGKVARLVRVIQASFVRLPDFNERIG